MKYYNNSIRLPRSIEHIPEEMDFLRSALTKLRINRTSMVRSLLLAEELMLELVQQDSASESDTIVLSVRSFLGRTGITITSRGDQLGISKKVYAFSIPLGATINMDGSCITQMISALFMAKIFGVTIRGALILSMSLTIFMLSVGAPGVPGGALVCIALLLPQYGIPAEGISLIMGLYSVVGMMQTCVNVTGDAAMTSVVARSEGLLDLAIFKNNRREE